MSLLLALSSFFIYPDWFVLAYLNDVSLQAGCPYVASHSVLIVGLVCFLLVLLCFTSSSFG